MIKTIKTEYIKLGGKPADIRSMTRKLEYFTVTQGACSDGRYVYMIFERKQRGGRTHRCKIVKLSPNPLKIVRVSGELKIGHGNDMTFRDGILYVTHSAGTMRHPLKLLIHRVDSVSLNQLTDVKVNIPSEKINTRIKAFNGIACFGKGFILRVMGSPVMLVTDSRFNAERYFRTEKFYRTSQGIEQRSGVTYRIYARGQSSRRNFLVKFDDSGCLLKRSLLEVRGEIEGIFFLGKDLYATVYLKTKKKDGTFSFAANIIKL